MAELKNVKIKVIGPSPGTFGITTRAPLHGLSHGNNEFTFEIKPEYMNEAFLFIAAEGYVPVNDLRLEMGNSYEIEMVPVVTPPDPPEIDEEKWNGNFLAIPGFEFAFMFPAWDRQKQLDFIRRYNELGHTHLPISPFARYDGYEYDYRTHPQAFIDLCHTLKDNGILPIIVTITNKIPHGTWTKEEALEYLDEFGWMFQDLTHITSQFIGGWEMSDVIFDGYDQLAYYTKLREILGPGPRIWYHDRPNWWAPHYPPYNEWDWWRHTTGILDGIAFQVRPHESIEAIEETLFKIDWAGVPTGIVGRVVDHLGKRFQMFEHSRDMDHYNKVLEIIIGDTRIDGYC